MTEEENKRCINCKPDCKARITFAQPTKHLIYFDEHHADYTKVCSCGCVNPKRRKNGVSSKDNAKG